MAARGTRGTTGTCGGRDRHIPVLLARVIETIAPKDGAGYIDATFGAGGYSRALLEAADCRVLAIDRDPRAIAEGATLASEFADRLVLAEGLFGDLERIVEDNEFLDPDGIVMDIGVSSMQIDRPERGFSFQSDGPLDMRMSGEGPSAADLVNELDERGIAEILKIYGEERRARAIARRIVAERGDAPIERTSELVALVTRVLGPGRPGDKHPATRTFQALRIAVNHELEQLALGLAAAERILPPGGRLVVVTFHSLEDRLVKRFLRARSGRAARGSRHLPPGATENRSAGFLIVNQRPLIPDNQELSTNPRARSARLRVAERTDAPSVALDPGELGLPVPRGRGR